MRSSKSRSRNKPNRSRGNTNSVGNVVNRVFDSSGPEGKVRGTPQQIIEKYNQLARDAQLSNDRVATENFQQHAEHYLRLLGSAQKEIDERREQQERENRDRQAERDRERPQHRQEGGQDAGGQDNARHQGGRQDNDRQENDRQDSRQDTSAQNRVTDQGSAPQPDVAEMGTQTSMLVETPESAAAPKRTPRKRTPRKPKDDDTGTQPVPPEATAEQASEPAPKPKPKPRAKAKPKDTPPSEAAE
jgi:hypothetical protein